MHCALKQSDMCKQLNIDNKLTIGDEKPVKKVGNSIEQNN